MKEHPFPKWWNCFERGRIPSVEGREGGSIEIWCYYWYTLAIRWYPPYWFRGWFVRRAIVEWTVLPVSLFLNLGGMFSLVERGEWEEGGCSFLSVFRVFFFFFEKDLSLSYFNRFLSELKTSDGRGGWGIIRRGYFSLLGHSGRLVSLDLLLHRSNFFSYYFE